MILLCYAVMHIKTQFYPQIVMLLLERDAQPELPDSEGRYVISIEL